MQGAQQDASTVLFPQTERPLKLQNALCSHVRNYKARQSQSEQTCQLSFDAAQDGGRSNPQRIKTVQSGCAVVVIPHVERTGIHRPVPNLVAAHIVHDPVLRRSARRPEIRCHQRTRLQTRKVTGMMMMAEISYDFSGFCLKINKVTHHMPWCEGGLHASEI